MSLPSPLEACWVDQSIGEADTNLKLKERFKGVSRRIEKWHYFESDEKFLDFIKAHPNVKLVAIMSGHLAKTLNMSNSHENVLHSIYVFCGNPDKYQNLIKSEPKVKGVFATDDELYEKMRRDLQ